MSTDQPTTPRPWPKHGERAGHDYRIFRSRFDELENPRTGERMERVILETPDWVNIVALDEEGAIVMIRQFRFGTGENTLELPGGMVDPGEDPFHAAKRELREETGYVSDDWTPLGFVEPNPAIQTNRCHHYLARGARQDSQQELDAGEDILVETMAVEDLVAAVHDGRVTHSLVITAIASVFDLRKERAT